MYWNQSARSVGVLGQNSHNSLELLAGVAVIPPLSSVTRFPPLAYMLNSVLRGFNFIKECNISYLQDVLCDEILVICVDLCNSIIKIAPDLRVRGNKYFNVSGSDDQSDALRYMDMLYIKAVCSEFIPYLLFCFERLYYKGDSGHTMILPLKSLDNNAYLCLNGISVHILTQCWKLFIQANLAPHD